MMRFFCVVVLFLSSLAPAMYASAQPRVLASIKPLQLIAAAVTDGVSEPDVVARAGADPHHYTLRPSERRAMSDADILLWVGPAFESFLVGVARELDAEVITAMALPGVKLLDSRGGPDPHLWLDGDNALTMARALAETLIRMDPGNAGRYRRNLEHFSASLEKLMAGNRAALSGKAQPRPYAVYHNAFQYFEQRHGLRHVVSFTDDEELKPGIRRLLEIKRELEQEGVGCILIEPWVNPAQLDNVVGSLDMRYITIDVLAGDIPVDKAGYPAFLEQVTGAMLDCLE